MDLYCLLLRFNFVTGIRPLTPLDKPLRDVIDRGARTSLLKSFDLWILIRQVRILCGTQFELRLRFMTTLQIAI